MKIHLVRHGQSKWQLEPSENWDTSLSDLGRNQAKRLSHWLGQGNLDIVGIRTSPLRRALETTNVVAEALNLTAMIDSGLREADFHVVDHLPSRSSPFDRSSDFTVSETYRNFKHQAKQALKTLIEMSECDNILAITHGGLIKTLLRVIAESDALCFRIYNTGITTIEWQTGRWHIVDLNRLDHLSPNLRSF